MSASIGFDIFARDRASAVFGKVGKSAALAGGHIDKTSGRIGKLAKSGVVHLGALAGVAGIGAVIKKSVDLEATFSKTMAQVAISTGAPKSSMKSLENYAMKMGAQTVFSANESADAMLELGKSGISTADIMGGGLKGTLTLAAAGSLGLADAATIASNSMNTFGLHGKDMGKIAAALAGAANASTASVGSLGQALSQVGPGARNAGLSLNDTVGVLAAFDNAGIKGSDAGTSLKTMLNRLVPSTKSGQKAMDAFGLSFTKANGEFKPMTAIAQQLKEKLGGLSAEQRNVALSQIFGSDASRAATVLMHEGAAGIEKYIRATKDQGAAQRMANANMSGTAGALETLSGAIDTAELKLGKALAPTIQRVAKYLSNDAVPAISKFIGQMQSGKGNGGAVARDLGVIFDAAKKVVKIGGEVAHAFDGLPDGLKKAIAVGGIATLGAKKLGLGGVFSKGAGTVAKSVTGGVQKVFVVNPGFGGLPGKGGKLPPVGTWQPVPGMGKPSRIPKGGGLSGLAGATVNTAGWAIISKLAGALDDKINHAKISTKGLTGELANFGKTGHAGGSLGKTFGKDLDDFAKRANTATGPTGFISKLNSGFGKLFGGDASSKSRKSIQQVDHALAKLSKESPSSGLRAYNRVLKTAGLSAADAAKKLPQATRAVRGMHTAAAGAKNSTAALTRAFSTGTSRSILLAAALRKSGMSAHQYGAKLHSLPKFVQTKVTTPGAITSRAQVRQLGHQFGLTPRQVRTLMQLAGVNNAVTGAARARAAYAGVPRRIDSYIYSHHVTTFQNVYNPSINKPRGLSARAGGGPVHAGQAYVVGENKREVFVPNTSGRILNEPQAMHALNGGRDAHAKAAPEQTLTVNLNLDGKTVQKVLLKVKQQNGGLKLGLA